MPSLRKLVAPREGNYNWIGYIVRLAPTVSFLIEGHRSPPFAGAPTIRLRPETAKHLGHSGSADPQIPGQSRPVLSDAAVEKALIEAGQSKRIAVNTLFLWRGAGLDFGVRPWDHLDLAALT
jgi:hypothetical protein